MKPLRHLIFLLAMSALLSGCIKNDIPYPRIHAGFSSIEVEGQIQAASIDTETRRVTFYLAEDVDIAAVKVTEYTLSPVDSRWADAERFAAGVDLTNTVQTVVSLYQDYVWSFSAVQDIERYFSVEGQIGAATIDVPGRRVVAEVPEHYDLSKIVVKSMKLAGPNATYSPDIVGKAVDFKGPVFIDVTDHGRTETWTLYLQTTESTVAMDRVDAWTTIAWAYASAQEGKDNGFEYRRADTSEWTRVPTEWITFNGGSFTGRIQGLAPQTAYAVRAYSDEEYTLEYEFTTEGLYSIPNGSMDNWWLDGKIWCPWPQNGERYWDTGNKGATTLGSSNSYPTDDTPTGTGLAACLETRFVGVAGIGKLAAGNLFVGSYVRTVGTNGVLSFGREFNLHPTALRGMMKYKTAPISSATAGFEYMKGQPDTCTIYIALIDTPEPFEIRTAPSDRHLLDPQGSYIVAYGQVQFGWDVPAWTEFEIPLVYTDTSRRPTYMILVASASKYGDYFTGGNGATLWVDDFQLVF